MSTDLFLTNTGDFSFLTTNTTSRPDMFIYNFHIATSESLLFNFNVVNSNSNDSIINPNIKPTNDREVVDFDDIFLIIDAKEGERIFVNSTKELIEVTETHAIMPIDEYKDEPITQTVIARYKILKYNFSGLQYNFYAYTPKYDKSIKTVSRSSFIQQAIKIRLYTELGTIRNSSDLGSDLYSVMHSNIPNDKLKVKIENLVKVAISDILPNATVTVYFLNTDYLNYHDSIKIVIINDEDVYYYTL